MILSLKYGGLSKTISETNRWATRLGQYCDDLSKRVQKKMYSVEGGMSSALNSADYYVNAKIKQLRTREEGARTLASNTQILLDTAKRVDLDVERTIQSNQQKLFERQPKLKAPWYQQAWTSFMCDVKKVPVLGVLMRGGEQILSAADTLIKDLRYRYKCLGGKEFVGIVLGVVGAILAVVILVCAVAFTGGTLLAVIAGVAGIISAMIGLVNSMTNVMTSFQARKEALGGHPGLAKIYSEQDKLSDVLRQTNFRDSKLNRMSNAWATGIDVTEAVCSIITLVKGAVNTTKELKKINISRTFQAMCQPRNALGQFTQGKPTLWNGLKSIALKFNVKDFVMGDLNVKNLSRLKKLPEADAFKAIGDLAKASKGIVSDLDKISDGRQTVGQFLAKRALTGVNTALFEQEVLRTKVNQDGVRVRKYSDTNFTAIVKAIRLPIDGLGVGKLLTDKVAGDDFSGVLSMKGGLIKSVADITKAFKMWKPPEVIFGADGTVENVKNWDSARGYFEGLNIKSIDVPTVKVPKMDTIHELSVPTYTMPSLDFNLKLDSSHPYYNVLAA